MWLYVSFLFITLPSALFIMVEKCVDLRSYKKACMANHTTRLLIIELLIISCVHLLNASISCFLYTCAQWLWNVAAFFTPLSMPFLSLIPMYLIERTALDRVAQKRDIHTKSFAWNLILALVFHVSCIVFGFCSIITFSELGIFGEKVDNTKAGIALIVVHIVLFVIFVLFKIVIQKVSTRMVIKRPEL